MRFSREALLTRLLADQASGVRLLEAPVGFGKSWLLRKASPRGTLRMRGEIGELLALAPGSTVPVSIDDAHLLAPGDVDRLAEWIEEVADDRWVIVAGRFLPKAIRDAGDLVDATRFDSAALSITAGEIAEVLPNCTQRDATRIVETAEGCVKFIASGLEQYRRDPSGDPVTEIASVLRASAAASLHSLSSSDGGLVGMLARAPGIDERFLDKLGGPGFVERIVTAGVPLRRRIDGTIDLVNEGSFRSIDVDPATALRLARELVERDRHIEAVGLLLDAGAHERAAAVLAELPQSVTDTVESRTLLSVLARLGSMTEHEPALLLLRSTALSLIGRFDAAGADLDRAMELVQHGDLPLRRRVTVQHAHRLVSEGRYEEARRAAEAALSDLGAGEERTYARAQAVLAEAAGMSDRRDDLQRAAEYYSVAIRAWEVCGEHAKARACRCDLATSALVPLGRYEEALAEMNVVLGASDLTEAEHAWMMLTHGFVLVNANRIPLAESRFERVAELGHVQANPRLVAAAAWGRALVAVRRDDLAAMLRWVATAENTALGESDDLLGLPFLCDVATGLGALGELDLAATYLARATERATVYPDQLKLADFVLRARRGEVGDVAAQLAITPPAEWWRVNLVTAFAAATAGDLDMARRLRDEAERDVLTFGFADLRSLGERRTADQLAELLSGEVGAGPAEARPAEHAAPAHPRATHRPLPATVVPPAARTLRVIGAAMAVGSPNGELTEVPGGNPQRLLGVVAASGGSATLDQLTDAIWPDEGGDASRARLRNVLLRLRRGVGDVVTRTASGVRLVDDVVCDLLEFRRLAADALAAVRTDPDLAGQIAVDAVAIGDGPVFANFEYEEWAAAARRAVDQQLLGLLDLLSVQAEDAGDLALAQSFAERALRLDRYSDSRYVRLAELHSMQGRRAAAVALLNDADQIAQEVGATLPAGVHRRRDDLLRRSGSG